MRPVVVVFAAPPPRAVGASWGFVPSGRFSIASVWVCRGSGGSPTGIGGGGGASSGGGTTVGASAFSTSSRTVAPKSCADGGAGWSGGGAAGN